MVQRLTALVSTLLLLGWFVLFRPATLLDGPGAYVFVSGTSMEPTMYTGDLAIMRRQTEYQVGDVIAFRAEDKGDVIHRVIGGNAVEGYRTQGDNRDTADLWRPTPDEIKGRMWFHIPWIGKVLLPLQQPRAYGALLGLAIGLALMPSGKAIRRRRKGGRQMTPQETERTQRGGDGGGDPVLGPLAQAPWPLTAAFLLASLAAIVAIGGAFLAHRERATSSETVARLEYAQTASLDYVVNTGPSLLYPDGTVRPALEPNDEGALPPEQPVYTPLARSIDVEVRYALETEAETAVGGTLGVDLEVGAPDGWTHRETLLAPRAFDGPETATRVRVDLPAAASLIARVEEETGFKASSYELRVVPRIHLEGDVGGEAVDTDLTPAFTMTWTAAEITPDGDLERSDPVTIADLTTHTRSMSLAGLELSVPRARTVLTGASAGLVVAALLLGASIYLGLGRGERAKVRARYGRMLLRVQQADEPFARDRVRLASMHDLARLAQRDGGIIFEEESPSFGTRYYVRDGDALYEYVPDDASTRTRLIDALVGGGARGR